MSAPEKPEPKAGWGWIVLAGVCACAIVGFFAGIGPQSRRDGPSRLSRSDIELAKDGQVSEQDEGPLAPTRRGAASAWVVPATRWADIRQGSLGPNAAWKTNIAMAGDQPRDPLTARPAQTPAQKDAALRARAARRAYAGAPPRTPHSVAGMSVYACQACHVNGLSVNQGQVIAPQMPHPLYINCLQCHETMGEQPPGGPATGREDAASGNTFVGATEAKNGPRFLPGAPPQIPHSTLMRSNCMSCHGTLGKQGMATPHPWRQSCEQCHAPGAALDQRGEAVEFRTPPAVKAYIDSANPAK